MERSKLIFDKLIGSERTFLRAMIFFSTFTSKGHYALKTTGLVNGPIVVLLVQRTLFNYAYLWEFTSEKYFDAFSR